jgi:hypothetical protein
MPGEEAPDGPEQPDSVVDTDAPTEESQPVDVAPVPAKLLITTGDMKRLHWPKPHDAEGTTAPEQTGTEVVLQAESITSTTRFQALRTMGSTLAIPFKLIVQKTPTPRKVYKHCKTAIARGVDEETPTTAVNAIQRYVKGLARGFVDGGLVEKKRAAEGRAYKQAKKAHPPIDTTKATGEELSLLLQLDQLRSEDRERDRIRLLAKYQKEADQMLDQSHGPIPTGKLRLAALGLVSNPNVRLANFALVLLSVTLSHVAEGASVNDPLNRIAAISNGVQSPIIGLFVANAISEVIAHGPKRLLHPATMIDFAMGYFQFVATGDTSAVDTSGRLIRLTSLIKQLRIFRSVAGALGAGSAAGRVADLKKDDEVENLDPSSLEEVNALIVKEKDEKLIRNTTWTIFAIIAFEVGMRLKDPSYNADLSVTAQWFNFYKNLGFDGLIFSIGVLNSMQIRKNTRQIANEVSDNAVLITNAGPVKRANELLASATRQMVNESVRNAGLHDALMNILKSTLAPEELRALNAELKEKGAEGTEDTRSPEQRFADLIAADQTLRDRITTNIRALKTSAKSSEEQPKSSINEPAIVGFLGRAIDLNPDELDEMTLSELTPRLIAALRTKPTSAEETHPVAPMEPELEPKTSIIPAEFTTEILGPLQQALFAILHARSQGEVPEELWGELNPVLTRILEMQRAKK